MKDLRRANQQLIDENPLAVVIQREEFVQALDGGRVSRVQTFPPFWGRLVPSKQQTGVSQTESGEIQRSAWVLIAPWDADIRAGSGVTDTFQGYGRNFRVVRVIPRRYREQLYAIHASIEEMK